MYTEESSDFLGHFLSGIPSTGGPARTPTGLGTPGRCLPSPGRGPAGGGQGWTRASGEAGRAGEMLGAPLHTERGRMCSAGVCQVEGSLQTPWEVAA